jgi:molecular chaperone DnaK (HSP70)
VIQSESNPQLTAYAIEKELMNHFGSEFKRKTGYDYTETRRAVYKLKSECERIKKDLSQMQQSNIQIDGFFEGHDLNSTITRARFEAITDHLLKLVLIPIQSIVQKAGGIDEIKGIILSGGNIKIPKIQQYMRQYFGQTMQIFSSIDPCDVNARGAVTQAFLIATRNPILKPKRIVPSCPLSIGLASSTGSFIPVIPMDTIVPVKIIKCFGIAPGQKRVLVSVYEGEDNIAVNNNLLGHFVFSCEGMESNSFQIGFIMDHNGVLKLVSKTGSYKIEGVKNRQSKEEVEKIRSILNK